MVRMETCRFAIVATAVALSFLGSAAAVVGGPARKDASPGHAAGPVLPWIEDDFARAVTEAKARKLPMFVESWAPW